MFDAVVVIKEENMDPNTFDTVNAHSTDREKIFLMVYSQLFFIIHTNFNQSFTVISVQLGA